MEEVLSTTIRELRERAAAVTEESITPRAEEVDRECEWPEHSMRALGEAGLLGLNVPRRLGGHGEGLTALATITETIAQGCASSALCYGMHCVATAVIAAKATPFHEDHYLVPIAEGRHVTTLALSESGTGVHFYLPRTRIRRRGASFVIEGTKDFVTNGGRADSYVVSTEATTPDADRGEFNCLLVDRDLDGMTWQEPWCGVGMRGNASCSLRLDEVRVPVENLLGQEGDQIWYVFEVVAPYFLMAMAATYLGIARAALDHTLRRVESRRFEHSGETLAEAPIVQHKVAEMWSAVERMRGLLHRAAQQGDADDPGAHVAIMLAKASAGDTAVFVTNEAMTLCGGMAFRENSVIARLLRDARASHVMAPTTDILKQWAGRALLGLPFL